MRGQGAAAKRHRLGARRDRHLRAEDRPSARAAADSAGGGGGAGLPAGRAPPVAASVSVTPQRAWSARRTIWIMSHDLPPSPAASDPPPVSADVPAPHPILPRRRPAAADPVLKRQDEHATAPHP